MLFPPQWTRIHCRIVRPTAAIPPRAGDSETGNPMKKKVVLFMPLRYDKTITHLSTNQALPLELLAISGPLLEDGFDVVIVDANVEEDYLTKVCDQCRGALCLGISAIFGYQVYDGYRTAMAVRESHPEIPIVWGGWFPSTEPKILFREGVTDFVVVGQGEETFRELAASLKNGDTQEGLKGIVYRQEGGLVRTEARSPMPLHRFPLLPFHLIDYEPYVDLDPKLALPRMTFASYNFEVFRKDRIRAFWYYSSWGCPNDCKFCASSGVTNRRIVFLPIPRMLDHLTELHKKHGFDLLFLADANFFLVPSRIRAFCQGLLERNLAISWTATAEARSLLRMEETDWTAIKESGCIAVLIGAESASPETLERIRKPVSPGDVEGCIRNAEKHDIAVNCNYIIGFPGESEDSIEATLRQARMLKKQYPRLAIAINPFWPLPGSASYPEAIDMGYQPPETLEAFADILDWRTNPDLYPFADRFIRRLSLMEAYQYWAYYAEIGGGAKGVLKQFLRWAGLLRFKMGFFSLPIELIAFDYSRNLYHRLKRMAGTP